MKLHYKGKYDMHPESLPHGEHVPGAVPFKEERDVKKLAVILNILGLVLILVLAVPAVIRYFIYYHMPMNVMIMIDTVLDDKMIPIIIIALFVALPHEFLHAICFKDDVYIYTNLKYGMLFVVGPETMSKERFVFMSLLPNIIFGFIPYLLGMLFPQTGFLLVFGTLNIGMGIGDYMNVFHALTQMPKGARTYLYQFGSYWYMPNE